MKILVTGGSGFIGSHVVDKLVDDGHDVRILDIKEPCRKDVDFYSGDICSIKDVTTAMKDIDVVYHMAAFSNIDLVKANPLKTIKLNIMGTAILLEAARKQRIKRFILASSVFVYGKGGHLYTTAKITSEMLCKDYQKLYGLPYTILQLATAYGPRSRGADVISLFVKNAIENKEITINGRGAQVRNFIYVEDLAKGCIAALNKKAENKSYILSGKKSVSILELSKLIRLNINPKVRINIKGKREKDYLGELTVDKGHMSFKELSWEPQFSLLDGLSKYKKWLIENEKIE